jgi:hypothetical protein
MTASISPPRLLAALAVGLTFLIAGLSLGVLTASSGAAAQSRLASFAEKNKMFPTNPASAGTSASALFAHTATRGSAVRARRDGQWVVRFKGVPHKALAFEDRPGRREEPIAMRKMLAGFFEKGGIDPPNAALSLKTRDRDQTLVGVELLDGRYNRDSNVARYRLRGLKHHGDQPLRLPRRFGDSSVFIDTFYNYCGLMVVNGPASLTLTGDNKYSYDDWDLAAWVGGTGEPGNPPFTLAPTGDEDGQATMWGSASGFARGCWNNAGYADSTGSVEFSVRAPYSDPNTWSCTATGGYVCDGPLDFRDYVMPRSQVSTSGNVVAAIYAVCSTSNPNCGTDGDLTVPAGQQEPQPPNR